MTFRMTINDDVIVTLYILLGSSNVTTKIVYFTPRSVTPFMTSISRPVGRITLRDFKALFDRPGFFRYHFKTMDKEFGMVKEEVRTILSAYTGVTIQIYLLQCQALTMHNSTFY